MILEVGLIFTIQFVRNGGRTGLMHARKGQTSIAVGFQTFKRDAPLERRGVWGLTMGKFEYCVDVRNVWREDLGHLFGSFPHKVGVR